MSELFIKHFEKAVEAFVNDHDVEPLTSVTMSAEAARRLNSYQAAHLLPRGYQALRIADIPAFVSGRGLTKVHMAKIASMRGSEVHFRILLGQDILESIARRDDLAHYLLDSFTGGAEHAILSGQRQTPMDFARQWLEHLHPDVKFSDYEAAEQMCVLFGQMATELEKR